MKSKRPRKPARSKRPASKRRPAPTRSTRDPLLTPIRGAVHREIGGVTIDIMEAANGRVKRVCYPPGFRWSTHMQPIVKTQLCMHAHVEFDVSAPRAVVLDPGHDAWVVGREPAVLIEFDALNRTAERFGLPPTHQHA